jgi:hypothetical protein
LQVKTKIVSCHTADSKPVKQEVNGTMILHPSVFPALSYYFTVQALTAWPILKNFLPFTAGIFEISGSMIAGAPGAGLQFAQAPC